VRVLWTHAAIAQLELIHNYVAQTSPEYAQRIVDQVVYLIKNEQEQIEILAVMHTSRDRLKPVE
jgi:plasmid stabilization system protein ParE